MAASSKISGQAIKRNKYVLTCSWKIPSHGYAGGQTFQFSYGHGWTNAGVSTSQKSRTVTFAAANFYPNAGKERLKSLSFRVTGKRSGGSWSGYSNQYTYYIYPPKPATLTIENQNEWPKLTFKHVLWGNDKDTTNYWPVDAKVTSVLVKDCQTTDGSKIDWSESYDYPTIINGSTLPTTRWEVLAGRQEGTNTIQENTDLLATGSYTRWMRIIVRGVNGDSDPVYVRHVYALPNECQITNYKATKNEMSSNYVVQVWFNTPTSAAHPMDSVKVEYATAIPGSNMSVPLNPGWSEGAKVLVNGKTGGASFVVPSLLDKDQCLFIRVNSVYNGVETPGTPIIADYGELKTPTGLSITAQDPDYHTATVEVTNNSEVPDSFTVIRYYSDNNPDGKDIGIIPHGQTTIEGLICPPWTTGLTLGAYAVAPGGCYTYTTRTDGVKIYTVTPKMKSSLQKTGGTVPNPPTNVNVTRTDIEGTVRVTWNWSWDEANVAELSWADHEDAWESTDEPSTYEITTVRPSSWNISGLDSGTTWYIRVRLISAIGDDKTYGGYSATIPIDLASAPEVPVLSISPNPPVIQENGQISLSWEYESNDGTSQSFADIAEVTEDNGSIVYTNIAKTQTAKSITLNAVDYGWHSGETHYFAVKVTSASGRESQGWSNTVSLNIAEAITCSIDQTSLEEVTVQRQAIDAETGVESTITEDVLYLTEMPLTVTVSGAGQGGQTTVSIERASDYHVNRPDETDFNGYAGETVASFSQIGESQITFTTEDLIGYLDDSAVYKLIATTKDNLGQSASDEITFEVHWEHQANVPTVSVNIDEDNSIAILNPIAPAVSDDILRYSSVSAFPSNGVSGKVYIAEDTGKLYIWDDSEYTENTDVCDIYRLSVDKPELIYKGANFGETYVDPYPTIGEYGGHRFVTRTVNGDYITDDTSNGSFAWEDTTEEDGDIFKSHSNIIDFDGKQVHLLYEVDLSNSWAKDFKETKYLGGSIQGDWNEGTSRTGSLSVTAVSDYDQETISLMRRLSDYAGICHVRSKDGSSYSADVQVQETYKYTRAPRLNEYSLTITRVDQENLDGMLYSEWLGEQ